MVERDPQNQWSVIVFTFIGIVCVCVLLFSACANPLASVAGKVLETPKEPQQVIINVTKEVESNCLKSLDLPAKPPAYCSGAPDRDSWDPCMQLLTQVLAEIQECK